MFANWTHGRLIFMNENDWDRMESDSANSTAMNPLTAKVRRMMSSLTR